MGVTIPAACDPFCHPDGGSCGVFCVPSSPIKSNLSVTSPPIIFSRLKKKIAILRGAVFRDDLYYLTQEGFYFWSPTHTTFVLETDTLTVHSSPRLMLCSFFFSPLASKLSRAPSSLVLVPSFARPRDGRRSALCILVGAMLRTATFSLCFVCVAPHGAGSACECFSS